MKTKTIYLTAALLITLLATSCSSSTKKADVSVDHLFSTYMTVDDLPTFTQRGTIDSVISLIETSFNSKKYENVNNLIVDNQDQFKQDDLDLIFIYQGVSYAKRGLYDKAYDVLANNEIYEDSFYGQMADWYLAMSMMKGQNKSEARKLFTKFAHDSNHYKNTEAKEILKKYN